MISNVERRNVDSGRIPFELPVELGHDGFEESFEADAVDLSPGGLSLRTACLPEVGEELLCRFGALPEGALVESRGRVVWTQTKGARSGEFGLRFTDLDDEAKALIDELVAERKVRVQAEAMKVAELQLAGVSAPLSARLLRSGNGEAVFEQTLPLLELGRAVVAKAGHVFGKGCISDVKLSLQGDTPTLAVTVRFEDRRSLFGEFEWEHKPTQDVDTVPDLDAPADEPAQEPRLRTSHTEQHARVTMVEFEAQQPAPAEHTERTRSEHVVDATAVQSESGELPAALNASTDAPLETRTVVVGDESADASDEQDEQDEQPETQREADKHEAWAHPLPEDARSSVLVRAMRVLVAIGVAINGASSWLVKLCGPGAKSAWGRAHTLFASRAVPMMRHTATSLWRRATAKPRRITTAPAAMHKTEGDERNLVRTVAIIGCAVCAVALSVYALAPSPADSAIELHRPVRRTSKALPKAEPAAAPITATQATPTEAALTTSVAAPVVAAPGKVNAAYASAMTGQPLSPPAVQPPAASTPLTTAPKAGVIPAASPYAVDVRNTPSSVAAAKPLQAAATFGQSSVKSPQRFVLRMSGPIRGLQGTGDKAGFTVAAKGVSSLDKAGPITASATNVARAAVYNKGGQAELTIRFVDGKTPAYRVSARGDELEILIGQ